MVKTLELVKQLIHCLQHCKKTSSIHPIHGYWYYDSFIVCMQHAALGRVVCWDMEVCLIVTRSRTRVQCCGAGDNKLTVGYPPAGMPGQKTRMNPAACRVPPFDSQIRISPPWPAYCDADAGERNVQHLAAVFSEIGVIFTPPRSLRALGWNLICFHLKTTLLQ